MSYNLQPTRLTLRFYKHEDGYAKREPFIGSTQVDLKSNGEAFIHAMVTTEPIKRSTFRKVANELACKYGVKTIKWEHSDKPQDFDTRPCELN